ncbi:recombinase family protein [Laribacter hongkongensis]|uniref:recombinase family protein n=1 Tax=Laribacter hongkongensis TaxID=168471 RepID=UPI001EFE73A4|nr:recombinase family protein [Laribacter hongkongensis]MCG9058025.1 recombinase family protein [Laribacter hongkongensis]MCG9084513.1 recombinase family protein [Laribacter hongkongensis]
MATIAYMRVSTDDQTIDNQRHQITGKGYQIDRTFIDEAVSGSINAASRDGFRAMLEYVRAGDTLVVTAIDRLGRNTIDVLQNVEALRGKGVSVVSLRESFDLTSPSGQFMLTMLAGLAQMEKAIIAERRDAGIARAKAQGKHCGRPRETPLETIREALKAHEGNISATARTLGISRQTVMRARESLKIA